MFLQTPYITHVPLHKQSNYGAESRRETEQSEKQARDERVPLNWWVWNGKVFMLNAAPPQGHGSSARGPAPCLRAAHHPIQMKCKSPLSPVPTMSIPLWLPAQPPSIQHLSLLPPRLFLFLLMLCLSVSLSLSQYPLSSISLGSFQLPAAVLPFFSFFSGLPRKRGWWMQAAAN